MGSPEAYRTPSAESIAGQKRAAIDIAGERDFVENVITTSAAQQADAAILAARQSAANGEGERQRIQNEGLNEVQTEVDRLGANLALMKAQRSNWDWNNIPTLVKTLGKMAQGDPGLIGELDDANRALQLIKDLERAKKQLEFVRTAQTTSREVAEQ